jgi:hypothetical protein
MPPRSEPSSVERFLAVIGVLSIAIEDGIAGARA